ncbi:MAG: delta-aminolevulinic acid dehydratase, partial [Candidatus Lokiarchaeota archaeon]|nr:delta-aminolevulinic acid dehydratase [Candidatus Lokiarchaeota archaeon]
MDENTNIKYVKEKHFKYIESVRYQGWDVFDGLNSRLFQKLPFNNNRVFRLLWIQFFKRSPINFRKITGVPKEYNPKGLALFISG